MRFMKLSSMFTALTAGILFFLAMEASANQSNRFFYIERSSNANKVYYEARVASDGTWDKRDPVHVFWILWAKDSSGKKREELSVLEKNMAYGLKISSGRINDGYVANIVAFPDKPIMFCMKGGSVWAEAVIEGHNSFLDKIYVDIKESKLLPLPKVNYVVVSGRDAITGELRTEKIIPK
jgi:hypothetical protein